MLMMLHLEIMFLLKFQIVARSKYQQIMVQHLVTQLHLCYGVIIRNNIWNNVFVAVGDNGEIVRSIDCGNNWIAGSSTPNNKRLWSVGYGNGVFIATGTGIILRSTNNGDTWTAIASPNTDRLNSVAYGDGTFLITVEGGMTLKSTDNGMTWSNGNKTHLTTGSWNRAIYVDRDDL